MSQFFAAFVSVVNKSPRWFNSVTSDDRPMNSCSIDYNAHCIIIYIHFHTQVFNVWNYIKII